MPYERSQALEKRLQDLWSMHREGRRSAHMLAGELAISQPTVARCLTALRKRGYEIKAVKNRDGWSYRLCTDGLASDSKELP